MWPGPRCITPCYINWRDCPILLWRGRGCLLTVIRNNEGPCWLPNLGTNHSWAWFNVKQFLGIATFSFIFSLIYLCMMWRVNKRRNQLIPTNSLIMVGMLISYLATPIITNLWLPKICSWYKQAQIEIMSHKIQTQFYLALFLYCYAWLIQIINLPMYFHWGYSVNNPAEFGKTTRRNHSKA